METKTTTLSKSQRVDMLPNFIVSLEDPNLPLSTSIYTHPGTGTHLAWVKVNNSVLEIHNIELLDGLIEILQATKDEILSIKQKENTNE